MLETFYECFDLDSAATINLNELAESCWQQTFLRHSLIRVDQPYVLSALTKPLARRLCLILPMLQFPAPFRVCDVRVHR